MPQVERQDGVLIRWSERGAGPALLLAHNATISMPSNLEALLTDLAADHRVVTFDPRGAGESSRGGPYDVGTDADDMAAVIEAVGAPVVAVSLGYNPVPLEVVTARPDLVDAAVLVGALPRLGPAEGDEDGSMLDSDSVIAGMLTMMRTDPRALLRTMLSMGNAQLTEDEVRARVAAQLRYSPPEVAAARGEAWLGHDGSAACTALAGRLWIVHWENPMSSAAAARRVRRLLPDAHLVDVEDGPISRPDLTAAVVRRAAAR